MAAHNDGAASAALDALVSLLGDAIADRVLQKLRAGAVPEMVDQAGSPLGRRRHILAVRRLVHAGLAGAAIVGRRYLLARDALERELAASQASKRPARAKAAQPERADELAALRERYGLERAPKARAS